MQHSRGGWQQAAPAAQQAAAVQSHGQQPGKQVPLGQQAQPQQPPDPVAGAFGLAAEARLKATAGTTKHAVNITKANPLVRMVFSRKRRLSKIGCYAGADLPRRGDDRDDRKASKLKAACGYVGVSALTTPNTFQEMKRSRIDRRNGETFARLENRFSIRIEGKSRPKGPLLIHLGYFRRRVGFPRGAAARSIHRLGRFRHRRLFLLPTAATLVRFFTSLGQGG